MPEPPWHAPAHLWGLPVTSWKKKDGFDLRGTLAECIARWLSLAAHHQRNCEMSCRDTAAGAWEAERIAAYIRTHGLPPAVLAARGGAEPSQEELERLTSMAWLESPRPGPGAGDASVHCQGFRR
jgi:hypothetical protein